MKTLPLVLLLATCPWLSWARAEYPVVLENASASDWYLQAQSNVNLFVKLQDPAGQPVIGERDGHQVELRMFLPGMDELRASHGQVLARAAEAAGAMEAMPRSLVLIPPHHRLILEFLGSRNPDCYALLHVVDAKGQGSDQEGLSYAVYRRNGKPGFAYSLATAAPGPAALFTRTAPDAIQLTADEMPKALVLPAHPLDIWVQPLPQ